MAKRIRSCDYRRDDSGSWGGSQSEIQYRSTMDNATLLSYSGLHGGKSNDALSCPERSHDT